MGPFPPLLAGEGVTSDQRRALAARQLPLEVLTLQATRDAVAVAAASLTPKELTLTTFRGEPYWMAVEGPGHRGLVPALRPHEGVLSRFTNQQMEEAARDAMPGAHIVDATWLKDTTPTTTTEARPVRFRCCAFAMTIQKARGSISIRVAGR